MMWNRRSTDVLVFLSLLAGAGLSPAAEAGGVTPIASVVEIDGHGYTMAEVQQKNAGAIFQARNALFDAERKAAEDFITDFLLNREAQKEQITVEQLVEKHAYSTIAKDPSDEALRAYYDGLDINEPFEAVRDKIRDVIRQRRMAKARTAYIQSLRHGANVVLRLEPVRAQVTTARAPIRGPVDAPVVLVEYADYECPYCQQIQPVVQRIEAEYKGRIAFAFKDVPLPMHANAQKAAEASHCAGAQGKYWEYHDRLFSTKQYSLGQLKDHSRALNLDQAAFDACLDSGAQAERIKADVAEAQSVGLPGTPGFFINGRFVNGAIDYQTLRQVVDDELRAATPAQAANALKRSSGH